MGSVAGTVVDKEGNDHAFKFENFKFSVDGTSYASRKAIDEELGGGVTFKDCTMTLDVAHRPWGYGGGGGGSAGASAGGAAADAPEEAKEEEEEEEEIDM